MSTTTTLSRYLDKDGSPANPIEETQFTDFTQIASCAIGTRDNLNQHGGEKLLPDDVDGTAKIPLSKRFAQLFV